MEEYRCPEDFNGRIKDKNSYTCSRSRQTKQALLNVDQRVVSGRCRLLTAKPSTGRGMEQREATRVEKTASWAAPSGKPVGREKKKIEQKQAARTIDSEAS